MLSLKIVYSRFSDESFNFYFIHISVHFNELWLTLKQIHFIQILFGELYLLQIVFNKSKIKCSFHLQVETLFSLQVIIYMITHLCSFIILGGVIV